MKYNRWSKEIHSFVANQFFQFTHKTTIDIKCYKSQHTTRWHSNNTI